MVKGGSRKSGGEVGDEARGQFVTGVGSRRASGLGRVATGEVFSRQRTG